MKLLVFGHAGAKVLVFPTRDGRFYEYENLYYHTPVHYLRGLNGWRLDAVRRIDIILVIGREDPFLDNNRYLSGILWNKGVWYALHEWDERAHRGHYWPQMAPLYV